MSDEKERVPYPGIYLNEPSEKAPEALIGRMSILLDKFSECVMYARDKGFVSAKGYINLDIWLNEDGKKNVSLNTFVPQKKADDEPADLPF